MAYDFCPVKIWRRSSRGLFLRNLRNGNGETATAERQVIFY